jgi:EAL domain-containing protein (putative c-di-GMP-specific phosphodiesterase class I)
VRSVVQLAQGLNLRVVAEGVETQAQLQFLRDHGCNEVQGYYYSYPLPAEELERFLAGASAT